MALTTNFTADTGCNEAVLACYREGDEPEKDSRRVFWRQKVFVRLAR
jgi:hypothetical protein